MYKEKLSPGEATNLITGGTTYGKKRKRSAVCIDPNIIRGGMILNTTCEVGFHFGVIPMKYYAKHCQFRYCLGVSYKFLLVYKFSKVFIYVCNVAYDEGKEGFPRVRKVYSSTKEIIIRKSSFIKGKLKTISFNKAKSKAKDILCFLKPRRKTLVQYIQLS